MILNKRKICARLTASSQCRTSSHNGTKTVFKNYVKWIQIKNGKLDIMRKIEERFVGLLLSLGFAWVSLKSRMFVFYEKASLRFITRRNSWRINQAVALCFIWAKRKKQISVSSRLCDYSQRHLSCFRSRIRNSASSLSNWSLQPLFLDNALPSFISTTIFPTPNWWRHFHHFNHRRSTLLKFSFFFVCCVFLHHHFSNIFLICFRHSFTFFFCHFNLFFFFIFKKGKGQWKRSIFPFIIRRKSLQGILHHFFLPHWIHLNGFL